MNKYDFTEDTIEIIAEALHEFTKDLNIPYNKVHIKPMSVVDRIFYGCLGYFYHVDLSINLYDCENSSDLLSILSHELVHLQQVLNLRLDNCKYGLIFEQKLYNIEIIRQAHVSFYDYITLQPWEKEASLYQKSKIEFIENLVGDEISANFKKMLAEL